MKTQRQKQKRADDCSNDRPYSELLDLRDDAKEALLLRWVGSETLGKARMVVAAAKLASRIASLKDEKA